MGNNSNGYEGIALEFQRDHLDATLRIEKHLARIATAMEALGSAASTAGEKLERLVPEDRTFTDDPSDYPPFFH